MPDATVDSQQFRPVEGAPQDEVSGLGMMVAGYIVVWLLMLAFVMRMGLLHRKVERGLARLKDAPPGGTAQASDG